MDIYSVAGAEESRYHIILCGDTKFEFGIDIDLDDDDDGDGGEKKKVGGACG